MLPSVPKAEGSKYEPTDRYRVTSLQLFASDMISSFYSFYFYITKETIFHCWHESNHKFDWSDLKETLSNRKTISLSIRAYLEATGAILVLRLHFELENYNLFSAECREGKAHLEMKSPERQLKAGEDSGWFSAACARSR